MNSTELIQKSLAPIQSQEFVLSIYFGRNLAKRYDRLSLQLFKLFQAPFLRATFAWQREEPQVAAAEHLRPIAASEIPADHHDFVVEVAKEYFAGKRRQPAKTDQPPLRPGHSRRRRGTDPPSNAAGAEAFCQGGRSRLGLNVEMIAKDDFGRLAEFDALFIRETTNVNHHTYRFARRAAAEGLVVVDDPGIDPQMHQQGLSGRTAGAHKIPAPRTLIVHRDNRRTVVAELGLPCILKQPDSSFSRGVVKVETPAELEAAIDRLLENRT